MQIPEGYVGLIWPRSGMAYKHGIDVFAGVIDSSYRGDVGVILYNSQYSNYNIEKGDRIAQIIFQKIEDFDLHVEQEGLVVLVNNTNMRYFNDKEKNQKRKLSTPKS